MPAAEPVIPRPEEGSRARVLSLLRAQRRPMTIPEVGERLGLHVNSVRLHLEQLIRTGLVIREPRRRPGRGRPTNVYAAVALPELEPEGADPEIAGYRLLAEILAAHIESAAPRPAEAAIRAGRAWAQRLAPDRPAAESQETADTSVAAATAELAELMDRLGFAPRAPVPGTSLELHRCPFGQVAQRHSSVVCGVHLGLIQGALAERGAPMRAAGLDPFVTPQMCLARFAPAAEDPSPERAATPPAAQIRGRR